MGWGVAYHTERSLKGFMRENGFRAVGNLAQRLTSGLAQQRAKGGRGASIARLRAEWSAIVGPDLARITRPEALISGRGARGGASAAGKLLRLRVPGASALEVQHKAAQVVERVNGYFGHKMIDDIRLVQGAIAAHTAPPPTPAPDPASVARAAERAASVQDPDLRAALTWDVPPAPQKAPTRTEAPLQVPPPPPPPDPRPARMLAAQIGVGVIVVGAVLWVTTVWRKKQKR
ncbi:hypothetical protein BH11PSE3_BH11PSE3_35190 [soil metagenome]